MEGARNPGGNGGDLRLVSGQRTVKIQLVLRDRILAAHGVPW